MKIMTREEFQAAWLPHGQDIFDSLVTIHGLSKEQANAEIQHLLEVSYKEYVADQTNKITSMEI